MASTPVSPTNDVTAAYGLSFQSLLSIILTQLTYQDPLKPLDNFQFVSQLAQFAQLQQEQTTNTDLTSLINAQSAMQATTMLGMTVSYTASGTTQAGKVTAVTFASGVPSLTITDSSGNLVPNIALSTITQVQPAASGS